MPNGPDETLGRDVARVIAAQSALAALLFVGTLMWSQLPSALGVLYGAALGIAGTLGSARLARRAVVRTGDETGASLVPLYLGEIQKLLLVGAGVAFGLVVLNLPALFLVAGLVVAQLGYVVASVLSLAGDR